MSIEANFVKQPQQASSWMDAAAEPIPLRVALQVGSSRPSSLRVHRAADPAVSAEAANNSCASATTIRRLSYAEVRSIFDCLHLNQPPPVDLPFTIVPAGPNSEKLSPPSFEFADGLYVLLRPEKKSHKKKNGPSDVPRAPSHLQHLVTEEIRPETCKWSLSGPQFPQPTAIQQRYCYPKGGRPDYSSHTGGALWTMYGADGQEDKEFRLLHVYFSAKRAVNTEKGEQRMENLLDDESSDVVAAAAPPKKRAATKRLQSAPRRAVPKPQEEQQILQSSPAMSTSFPNSRSYCSSPMNFSAANQTTITSVTDNSNSSGSTVFGTWPEELLMTPIHDPSPQPQHELHRHRPRQHLRHADDSFDESLGPAEWSPRSPFRRRPIHSYYSPMIRVQNSPLWRTGEEAAVAFPLNDVVDFNGNENFSWQQGDDLFGNDPFTSLMLMLSQDDSLNDNNFGTEQRELSFVARLDVLQGMIRDSILAAPEPVQPKFVSLIAGWARTVAEDPLLFLATTLFDNNRIADAVDGMSETDERYYPNSDHTAGNAEDSQMITGV